MKLPQLSQICFLLVKIILVKSHYWPNGYNRVSRGHTWSSSPLSSSSSSSSRRFQQQLYQAPSQLYQQPQQLYSSPVVQQQQPTQPPVSRTWSQPRNSVIRRGWPVKGKSKHIKNHWRRSFYKESRKYNWKLSLRWHISQLRRQMWIMCGWTSISSMRIWWKDLQVGTKLQRVLLS